MPRFKQKVKRGDKLVRVWDGYLKVYHKGTHRFPSGLAERVAAHLENEGDDVEIVSRFRQLELEPQLFDGTSTTELRPYQIEAVEAGLEARTGVFAAATGLGKTEIMGELIRRTQCRTLVLLHQSTIAHQTIDQRFIPTLTFPNAKEQVFGFVGDGVDNSALVTVGMYQTIHFKLEPPCRDCGANTPSEYSIQYGRCKKCSLDKTPMTLKMIEDTLDWLDSFEAIHLDECHRAPAKTWWPIIMNTPAYYRFGYSATPFKSDKGTELRLVGATGEICFSFPAEEAIEEGWLTKPLYVMIRLGMKKAYYPSYSAAVQDGIVDKRARNEAIADLVKAVDQPTLVLVERVAHGKMLKSLIKQNKVKVEFLSGNASSDQRIKAIAALRNGDVQCLVVTTIFDEGVDIPEIGALVLAGGGKAHHRVIQRIGRGLRVTEGKDYIPIFDFLDDHSIKTEDEDDDPGVLWLHSRERLVAVKEAGFDNEVLTLDETMGRLESGDMRK